MSKTGSQKFLEYLWNPDLLNIYPELLKINEGYKNLRLFLQEANMNKQEKDVIFSAHSMDTSFYALRNGTLVEFWTGEPGVVPEEYPTREDIDDKLIETVHNCQDLPQVKRAITDLKKDYKISNTNEMIRYEPTSIIGCFIYTYSSLAYGSVEEDIISLLKGEMDERGNIYRYDLTEKPTADLPPRLLEDI